MFTTIHGSAVPAVGAAGMKELDRVAIEETGPNLFQMMENAGRNLAESALERLAGAPREGAVLIAAGSGGNGGGGMCAARHLANHGYRVTLLVTRTDGLAEVPGRQLALAHAAGAVVDDLQHNTAPVSELVEAAAVPALILDCVLGYSVSGVPRGPARELIEGVRALRGRRGVAVIALDLPSGINADDGTAAGSAVEADATMTLALPKTGLASSAHAGRIFLADIGIPRETYLRAGIDDYHSPFGRGYRVEIRAP